MVTELVRRIRKKFSVCLKDEVIETVWGSGYRWKIRNLSIRRSFALYLSVAMILSFFCAVLVQGTAEQFQIHLYRKHLKEETYYEALEEAIYEENLVYWGNSHGVELSDVENFLSETCDFLITWSGLLIPMIGCGGAILLFTGRRSSLRWTQCLRRWKR